MTTARNGESGLTAITAPACADLAGEDLVARVDALSRSLAHYQVVNRALRKISVELDFDKAINAMLSMIGKELHADRCYIFHFTHRGAFCDNTFEWTSRPELAEINNLQHVDIKNFCWHDRLLRRQPVVINDIDAPPRELLNVAEFLRAQHIKSIFVIGLWAWGRLYGFLGVDFVYAKHSISDGSLQMLEDAAKLYDIARARARRTKALEKRNEELRRAMNAASSAVRAKSEFLATISHELRTPLNSVIGFSELLDDDGLSKGELREYAHNINVAGQSLLGLINDILDLSKLEAARMPIVLAPLSLKQLFDELAVVFGQTAAARGLKLEFVGTDHVPVLMLDGLRLKQILLNLIGNALKFTHAGCVTVAAEFADGELKMSVSDTGIGISPELRREIFKPFVQGDAPRETQIRGTGLGLDICRKLAERMGGTIGVESTLGKGSTFMVKLEHVKVRSGSDLTAETVSQQVAVPPGLRVLLVDDVSMNLRLLEALCRRLGVATLTAASGREALTVLASEAVDAVLTDLWMPGMTGAELAERLRQIPGLEHLPVAAVTADTENASTFDRSLFAGVLVKPIAPAALAGLLASCAISS